MSLPKLLALMFAGLLSSAQAQTTAATILGVVRDASGAVVPQASVTARNTQRVRSQHREAPFDVDTHSSTTGEVVDHTRIQELPLNPTRGWQPRPLTVRSSRTTPIRLNLG